MSRVRLLSTAQVRALESSWIKNCHDNWGLVLMEQAGLGATRVIGEVFDGFPAVFTILCGRGNNGGDGLVIARHLLRTGAYINVFTVGSPDSKFSPDQKTNRQILERLGVTIRYIEDDLYQVKSSMAECAIIVDALLGTGLDRPVEGIYAELIEAINESGKDVFSVDMPSGVNSDTGAVMGVAVAATATCTFGTLKPGLVCYPGAELAGEIRLVDIGLPLPSHLPLDLAGTIPELHRQEWWLATRDDIAERLPERAPDSHKGSFGQVLLVAGSRGMTGAAMLAAKSSLRAGAGLAVLATPSSVLQRLPGEEVIYRGLAETESGSIALSALEEIESAAEESSVMVVGPGLSTDPDTVKLVGELVKRVKIPCVLDADGLNALSKNSKALSGADAQFILTPHPKELSRLTGQTTDAIQADRIGAANRAARKFGATVILKGAHSVVAGPDDEVYVVPTGNSGMATAGSGDVLSGVVAGLLAQGLDPFWSAVAGTYIHGAAGDLAADEIGEDGMIAGDIMQCVPSVIKFLRERSLPWSKLETMIFGEEKE